MATDNELTDFMRFQDLLDDEEKLVRQTARIFVNEQVVPIIDRHAQDETFPRHLVPEMGRLGFFGPTLPEEYGCAGLSSVAYGLLMYELERGDSALRSMAWGGRYLVIGFAGGDIPRVPLNLPLLKGCSIVGVFWGSFAVRERDLQRRNVMELWEMFEAGRLVPVVGEVHPLADFVQAFESLASRRAQGKVVLLP